MTDRYVLDADRNPVPCPDLAKWGRSFDARDRRVAGTEVGDARISTIFLAERRARAAESR